MTAGVVAAVVAFIEIPFRTSFRLVENAPNKFTLVAKGGVLRYLGSGFVFCICARPGIGMVHGTEKANTTCVIDRRW